MADVADSSSGKRGGVADSKYSYDGEGKPGKIQKIDRGVSAPLVIKEDDEGRNAAHGIATVMGRRRELTTDASAVTGETLSYDAFGIFEGTAVLNSSGQRLLRLVTEAIGLYGGGEEAVDWDKVVRESSSGVSRAVLIIGKDEAVVLCSVGGTRAVLCRRGAAVPLTHDDDDNDKSDGEETVKTHGRTEMDEFIVMGSSGVWDVVSEHDTCQLVKRCLDNGKSPDCSAAVLAELAIARGSKDNISVIVIYLKSL